MKLDFGCWNNLLIFLKSKAPLQPAYRFVILSFVLSVCLVVIVSATSNSIVSYYPPIKDGALPPSYPVQKVEYKQVPKLSLDRKFLSRMTVHLRGTKYAGADNYTRYTVAHLGLKPLKHVRPIRYDIGPVFNDVTSFNYPISIEPCPNNVGLVRPSLLIVVISEPSSFEKRNVIRRTWKKHLKHKGVASLIDVAGFAFLVGKSEDSDTEENVESEHENHGDIIRVDVIDSSDNATMKIASLLNWTHSKCPRVHFVLKVDDVVYVNVRNLAATLTTLPPGDQCIYGMLMGGNVPARNKNKWSYSFETWPWSRLPLYLNGPGYLISGSAITPLLAATQTTPYFISDDIYLSGICNRRVGIPLRESTSFLSQQQTAGAPTACFVKRTVMWLAEEYLPGTLINSNGVLEEFYHNTITCSNKNKTSLTSSNKGKHNRKHREENADDPFNYMATSFKLVQNPDLF